MDFVASVVTLAADMPVQPQSWGAWAALIFGAISCALLVYDRLTGSGKHDAKIDDRLSSLYSDVEDFKEAVRAIDNRFISLEKHIQTLIFEVRGVDGMNGMKSIQREHSHRITAIETRNHRIDAVSELEKQRMKEVGRQPERVRDRILEEEEHRDPFYRYKHKEE